MVFRCFGWRTAYDKDGARASVGEGHDRSERVGKLRSWQGNSMLILNAASCYSLDMRCLLP